MALTSRRFVYKSASEMWSACAGLRSAMITRTERYAALTVPKIMLPDGFDAMSTDQSHDYQSIGAQAVNHLANKLMLAMFAPSRPFMKLKPGKQAKADAAKMNLTDVQLNAILANGEREAIAALDNTGQRPRLFQVMRHLIITGNTLLYLGKDRLRTFGLKNYVVKRDVEGNVLHIVVREHLRFDELETKIVDLLRTRHSDESKVMFYRWIKREHNGSYTMSQWVDEVRLPKEYAGKWPADKLPYQALAWDLADEDDYGTGLVEEYVGDLEACSVLSEATVDGAVLGTEYRWMVNPTGQTSIDDINNSENGDALSGLPTDVAPTQGGNPQAITVAEQVNDKYERRISRGFLMGSAVIRDAERVTTEEVRLTAMELETAYGSVYSTLAVSLQLPVGNWLFDLIELKLGEADLKVTIVTGLDALSRNGDLENFRLAMGDMAAVTAVPPELAARMKWEEVAAFIGQGRGVDLRKFIMTDAEFSAKQLQQQQAQVAQRVATTAGESAATQGT